MNKTVKSTIAALSAIGCVLTAAPALAQNRQETRHTAQHNDQRNDQRNINHNGGNYRTYGGSNGYNGYKGKWRTGQRFTNYRNQQYVISDYGRYNLPPPRQGYRYYRDNNGDVVMAAVATGVIGLILGGALSGR